VSKYVNEKVFELPLGLRASSSWHVVTAAVASCVVHLLLLQLLSGSNAGCKLWSPTTGTCLGSIDTGYALCCAYVPGNRHALVGTKVSKGCVCVGGGGV